MDYELKEAKTFDEQISLLKSRGMIIDDDDYAKAALQHLNYYRFSGYACFFRKPDDRYQDGTRFDNIVKIMEFDSELRRILLAALESIELHMRTQIAYHFSHNHGGDGGAYYDASLFKNPDYHAKLIDDLNHQIEKNRFQPFVKHNLRKYGGRMPLWCATEIMTFSMLSKLYSNMLPEDKKAIADAQNMDMKYLGNWLHCFSLLRNICAHYGRLYNTQPTPAIRLGQRTLKEYTEIDRESWFPCIICILRTLSEEDRKKFQNGLSKLLEKYVAYIELQAIGFPQDWKELIYDPKLIELKPKNPAHKNNKAGTSLYQ